MYVKTNKLRNHGRTTKTLINCTNLLENLRLSYSHMHDFLLRDSYFGYISDESCIVHFLFYKQFVSRGSALQCLIVPGEGRKWFGAIRNSDSCHAMV